MASEIFYKSQRIHKVWDCGTWVYSLPLVTFSKYLLLFLVANNKKLGLFRQEKKFFLNKQVAHRITKGVGELAKELQSQGGRGGK